MADDRPDLVQVDAAYLAALVRAFHILALRVDWAGGNPTPKEAEAVEVVRTIQEKTRTP